MKRGTKQHPKFKKLARLLQLPEWGAVGVLESLWYLAAEFFEEGDIGRWSDQQIADAVGWSADARQFVMSLLDAGWLDEVGDDRRLVVHDWFDHCPNFVSDRFRKREERRLAAERSGIDATAKSARKGRLKTALSMRQSGTVPDTPGQSPLSGPGPGSKSGPNAGEDAGSAAAAAGLILKCLGKGEPTWSPTKELLDGLQQQFPMLAVREEARKARDKLELVHAQRRPVHAMPQFLVNWMERANKELAKPTKLAVSRKAELLQAIGTS